MAIELIPGLEGVPIAESAISFVDGKASRLEYRGMDISLLAEHSTFEETSFLLLYGRLPTVGELAQFSAELNAASPLKFRIVDLMKCLPETGHPMDALQAAIAAIGMFYPPRHNMDEAARDQACRRLIAKTSSVVAAFRRLRRGDGHLHDLLGPWLEVRHPHVLPYLLGFERGVDACPPRLETNT